LYCLFVPKHHSTKTLNYSEIGALFPISNSLNDNSKFTGFRTRTGISKMLDDHFALGLAFGTDNYRKVNGSYYNTLPITLNASWYLNPELNGLRGDLYGGYAVKLYNNLNRGLTAGVGIAYWYRLLIPSKHRTKPGSPNRI
jgi:hypothetical protein